MTRQPAMTIEQLRVWRSLVRRYGYAGLAGSATRDELLMLLDELIDVRAKTTSKARLVVLHTT